MQRAGRDYYEYRDTVTSSLSQFRPEWIKELCIVDNNDVDNPLIQWNNGHFMHQFTYFIGHVNFYFMRNGKKEVAIMNTGDSMYITPFIPHTFATRKNRDNKLGLILALTYGNKLSGDAEKELSAIGPELGPQFYLDFLTKGQALASLLKFHREASSLTLEELAKRSLIEEEKLMHYESGDVETITESNLIKLAYTLNV
ncbi:MAG: hypothetical protein AABY07_06845, partial [Nanoarchaeota archaeon]